MNYLQAREFIHGIETGPKPGLRRITALLELMGNPQDTLQYVHVAGTNGKGSTCTMLSHVLVESGYKVGLNISPFVLDFRERFQINNTMISEQELVEIVTYIKPFWDILADAGDAPSEFEVVTAIAFEFFARNQCDIVVLEVGVGGRCDATNVIKTPLVSVIASISVDHVDSLGTSVSSIAREKAGIIKGGGSTVTYPKQEVDALAILMERCAEMDNTLYIPTSYQVHSSDIHGSDVTIDGLSFHIPLAGEHQVYNATMVVGACRVLQQTLNISEENICKGIEHTSFPSRVEVLSEHPLVILDGAHNLSGANALANMLDSLGGRTIHAVIGIMQDKDVDGFIHVIAERCTSIITTSLEDMPRFISPVELAEKARRDCDDVQTEPSPRVAYEKALAQCEPEDILLVCGSFYLTSDIRLYVLGEYDETKVG